MCESVDGCNLCIVGDFNASDENMFGKFLINFCAEYSYFISDRFLLPANTFMYVSDCHGSSTWIDHCQGRSQGGHGANAPPFDPNVLMF